MLKPGAMERRPCPGPAVPTGHREEAESIRYRSRSRSISLRRWGGTLHTLLGRHCSWCSQSQSQSHKNEGRWCAAPHCVTKHVRIAHAHAHSPSPSSGALTSSQASPHTVPSVLSTKQGIGDKAAISHACHALHHTPSGVSA